MNKLIILLSIMLFANYSYCDTNNTRGLSAAQLASYNYTLSNYTNGVRPVPAIVTSKIANYEQETPLEQERDVLSILGMEPRDVRAYMWKEHPETKPGAREKATKARQAQSEAATNSFPKGVKTKINTNGQYNKFQRVSGQNWQRSINYKR